MQNTELTNTIENINREMQQAFSSKNMKAWLATDIASNSVQLALETHILSPCLDIMNRGGKRLRPLLLLQLTKMLSGDEEAAYKFSPVIEGLHTASLIHDDIEDASLKRRGEVSAHIKYGMDVSLNAAAALYFFAIKLIEEQKTSFKLSLYQECIASLSLLHLGQAMDIKHHSNYSIPFNYEIYERISSLKTGTLFSLAIKVALIFSQKQDENMIASKALNELGVAFQMFDDLANISSGNKGKDRGDDIVEGKMSFPIVLYLQKDEKNKAFILQFFEQAKKEGITSQAVATCCALLEESGVIKEGLSIAKEKRDKAFSTLESIFGTSSQLDMIKSIFTKN